MEFDDAKRNYIALKGYEVSTKGLAELKEDCEHLAALMDARSTKACSITECEKTRADVSRFVRDIDRNVKLTEEAWLSPVREAEAILEETLAPLRLRHKRYQAEILDVKKRRHREEAERLFQSVAEPSEDGEMPSFDEIYDPSWYGKTKDEWTKELILKCRRFWKADQQASATIEVEATNATLDKIEDFLLFIGAKYHIRRK